MDNQYSFSITSSLPRDFFHTYLLFFYNDAYEIVVKRALIEKCKEAREREALIKFLGAESIFSGLNRP